MINEPNLVRIKEPYNSVYHFRLNGPADRENIDVIMNSIGHLRNSFNWYVLVEFPNDEKDITFLAVIHANPFDSERKYAYIVGITESGKNRAYIYLEDYMAEWKLRALCHDYMMGRPEEWNELDLKNEPGTLTMSFSCVSDVYFDSRTMRPVLPDGKTDWFVGRKV